MEAGPSPDGTYSPAMAQRQTQWSSAWQKVQVSGRGPKRKNWKEAAAFAFAEGVDAATGALYCRGGRGGGAMV